MAALNRVGAAIIALLAAGTASCDRPRAGAAGPSLAGTEWVVTHLQGKPLALATTARPATLAFGRDGQFGGFSGCNDYGGRYRIIGGRLDIPEGISSHMVGCEGEGAAVEQALYTSLDEPFVMDQHGGLSFGDAARPILRLEKKTRDERATP